MTGGTADLPALARRLSSREISAEELLDTCLARIRARDAEIGAFLYVDESGARAAARGSDQRRARGEIRGPLDGIPFAAKDNIAAQGLPVTCGSRFLEGYRSPYDATAVARLREAGAVLVGKTNLDEFGMGSSNEHSAFRPVRNPHDPARVPGGSSGGSCAAVADGMVPLALGTDTGGSVRLPASWCGVVGLRPSWGRVSRSGLVAFASSLDQIGTVATSVAGAAAMLEAISGKDPRDATSSEEPPADLAALEEGVSGMRVGLVPELMEVAGVADGIRARVEEAAAVFERLGATLVRTPLPHARYAIAAYYILSSAEASSNLARYDGVRFGRRAEDAPDLEALYTRSRSEGFGDEVRRRILLGTFALSSGYHDRYYGRALKVRALIARDYRLAFAKADVLLSPVAPGLPFRLGDRDEDPLAMYLTDAMTIPASLAGIPAISVPCPVAPNELPIGLQIQAPYLAERTLLRAAAAWERARGAMAGGGAS